MRLCLLVVILSTAATTASAQSLADVARQENQRRQAVGDTGKTYTNKDLKPVPAPQADAGGAAAGDAAAGADSSAATSPDGSAAAPADASKADGSASPAAGGQDAADAAAPGGGADAAGEAKDEAKGQEYWASRMADLRERLDRDQTFAEALQNRIDALTTDFVNRDDPAQRAQIADDRQKALTELDRVRKAIEEDRRAIPELEEEARRAGVPAGWLR